MAMNPEGHYNMMTLEDAETLQANAAVEHRAMLNWTRTRIIEDAFYGVPFNDTERAECATVMADIVQEANIALVVAAAIRLDRERRCQRPGRLHRLRAWARWFWFG